MILSLSKRYQSCRALLKSARFKYGQAAIEDVDSRPSRPIDRAGHSVQLAGPTG